MVYLHAFVRGYDVESARSSTTRPFRLARKNLSAHTRVLVVTVHYQEKPHIDTLYPDDLYFLLLQDVFIPFSPHGFCPHAGQQT